MKKSLGLTLFIVFSSILLSCSIFLPIRNDANQKLRDQIGAILHDTLLSPCFIGIKIVSLQDGRTLYEQNGEKLFHPGSNLKLFTTSAAANVLGPDYKGRTRISTDGTLSERVLSGNLLVKGFGDPLIKTDDLDSMAVEIANYGIRSIQGDLVGDVSYFDSLVWGHGWMWDDEPESDEAFITPLTVNANAITVMVKGGSKAEDTPTVSLQPQTSYVSILNQAVTSSDTVIPPLRVSRTKGNNKIIIEGRIPPDSQPKEFSLSVFKPEMYFLHLLKERLTFHGITVKGTLRIDSTRGRLTIDEVTHPIDSILHQVNKSSDNIAAENLLKILAVEKRGAPGTAMKGITILKEYLVSEGIDTTNMMIADGSGVSWYSAVSPNTIVQLLQKQYQHKIIFDRFLASLPIAGVDGTLKNRMKGANAAGNVRAKTGTLTGVSAISGYVTSADGKLLAFSILCNHYPREIAALRSAQDRILELLAGTSISNN
ncbi:MAG: D-alanyl-D-alanine carboxypeptidase/D-alanyl-D-alanine-endopeptidase [Ignavibacteria bacterium]|nr:D-alanyl-D-alanine carboxypeptidase/D-alanyl-D-alanine-endopeptidase [Ignavibacteria bacterium]MBI3766699.1 D-alanyl-D-alanine carboxypeptidase/D-alanyl-D-alanine-endopeptidase [Ignavibacteriales bacterium]